MEITLLGSLWNARTDAYGDSKITFQVPQDQLSSVVSLMALTETLLRVTVTVEDGSSVVAND